MNFDELEESVQELEILLKEDPKKASVIENTIIQRLKTEKFEFPVEDDVLLNNGNASFIYKNNKTYPILFTFFGKIFNTDIPITIGICKFGPGEILLKADNRNQALENLSNGTQEFHRLIKNIK